MLCRPVAVLSALVSCVSLALAGNVSFHNPVQWSTLRTPSIDARASIDTAGFVGKSMTVTLCSVTNGTKTVLGTHTSVVKEPVYEHSFPVKKPLVGGGTFLSIEWKVDTLRKGTLSPIGIAPISASAAGTVKAKRVGAGATVDSIRAAAASAPVDYFWSAKGLFIRTASDSLRAKISVAIDPKNGKNAFCSFADRFVTFYGSDSTSFLYVKRSVDSASIRYLDTRWNGECVSSCKSPVSVVFIPWYDLGMKAVAGRVLGCAVFTTDARASIRATPEGADARTPATWGNLVLAE